MKTKFIPTDTDFLPEWLNLHTSAEAWLDSYILIKENESKTTLSGFYVLPTILSFCLELYIKSLVVQSDDSFQGIEFKHKTTKIIDTYKTTIPLLAEIYDDKSLYSLIKEYEKTINLKYGELDPEIHYDEQKELLDTIYTVRDEVEKRGNYKKSRN